MSCNALHENSDREFELHNRSMVLRMVKTLYDHFVRLFTLVLLQMHCTSSSGN